MPSLDRLRHQDVNALVHSIAALADVRQEFARRQRELVFAWGGRAVVEGRDTGSVVFPEAIVKVFLTASLEERARRRVHEGIESISARDNADTKRVISPLEISGSSLVIDTTDVAVEKICLEILAAALNVAVDEVTHVDAFE